MNYSELKDSISELSNDELNKMLIVYNNNFITEQKFECIKLVLYEIEKRRLSQFINDNVDLKILLDYNLDILWKIDNNEIKKSLKFLNNNKININGIIRWIPIFLSMNRVYYIYNNFKNLGYSNDKIFNELIIDIRIYLNKNIVCDDKYLNDKEFIEFIVEIVKMVNDRCKDTDVYKRMMNNLIEENSYALNHLI